MLFLSSSGRAVGLDNMMLRCGRQSPHFSSAANWNETTQNIQKCQTITFSYQHNGHIPNTPGLPRCPHDLTEWLVYYCTVKDFSAEDKASGVKFCMVVHQRPEQKSHILENIAPPDAQHRPANRPASALNYK